MSLTAFHSDRLTKYVATTICQQAIDTIVIFSGQMGQYIPSDFKGRVIIDLCDVDSAKFDNYAEAGERVWLNRREGNLLAREEERLARRADATLLISDAEAELFWSRLELPSMANIHVIGNGIDAAFFHPEKVEQHPDLTARSGPHFVFTGQMDYRPNEQAAFWVVKNLLPELRKRFASAEFHVVGRNPTPKLQHCDVAGLTVWGEVPDVRPFLKAADCVLAPLLIARGVQNKVLEAMAMELPVLVTPQAATGIEALDDEHWMVADANPEVMRARIEGLLADKTRAESMAQAARQFVLANHVWDAMLSPLEVLVSGEEGAVSHAA